MSSRDEYVEKMKHQLDEWNKDIDRLEIQISEVQSSAKEELQTRLKQAREGYETAKERLQEMRAEGDESWEKARGWDGTDPHPICTWGLISLGLDLINHLNQLVLQ